MNILNIILICTKFPKFTINANLNNIKDYSQDKSLIKKNGNILPSITNILKKNNNFSEKEDNSLDVSSINNSNNNSIDMSFSFDSNEDIFNLPLIQSVKFRCYYIKSSSKDNNKSKKDKIKLLAPFFKENKNYKISSREKINEYWYLLTTQYHGISKKLRSVKPYIINENQSNNDYIPSFSKNKYEIDNNPSSSRNINFTEKSIKEKFKIEDIFLRNKTELFYEEKSTDSNKKSSNYSVLLQKIEEKENEIRKMKLEILNKEKIIIIKNNEYLKLKLKNDIEMKNIEKDFSLLKEHKELEEKIKELNEKGKNDKEMIEQINQKEKEFEILKSKFEKLQIFIENIQNQIKEYEDKINELTKSLNEKTEELKKKEQLREKN